MAVSTSVLFDKPQREIASSILSCMEKCSSLSIVTGFATPGGLEAIGEPILARPKILKALIIGAANYRSFEVLDAMISAGVSAGSLYVHLGHNASTGWPNKPSFSFHPMLHSKIYYLEFPDSTAAAFIGSHNLTHFALDGLNGEASIRLDGGQSEFGSIRDHIAAAQNQARPYSPSMKQAYAWWFREFFDGLKAMAALPNDWKSGRTILIFAEAATAQMPKSGEHLYFEIPDGIEQVNALSTEVHLFLFKALPSSPEEALARLSSAVAQYRCQIEGAENRQGNREVLANWQIDPLSRPRLTPVPTSILRPTPRTGMQQVRAEFGQRLLDSFDYSFERELPGWDAELSPVEEVRVRRENRHAPSIADIFPSQVSATVRKDARDGRKSSSHSIDPERATEAWHLVTGLTRRAGAAPEKDREALRLARPESGAFILVSLQRRKRDRVFDGEGTG